MGITSKSLLLLLLVGLSAKARHPEGLFEISLEAIPRPGMQCDSRPEFLPDRIAMAQSLTPDGLIVSFVAPSLEEPVAYFSKVEFKEVGNPNVPQLEVHSLTLGAATRFTMFLNGDGTFSGRFWSARQRCAFTYTGRRIVSLYDYPSLAERNVKEKPASLAQITGDYDFESRDLKTGKVILKGTFFLNNFASSENGNASGSYIVPASGDFEMHFPLGFYDEATGALTLTGNQDRVLSFERLVDWELRQQPTGADGKIRFEGYQVSILQGRASHIVLIRR